VYYIRLNLRELIDITSKRRKRTMMGRKDQSRSSKPFYVLDLEKEIPEDHILRKIDALLDLSFLYKKMGMSLWTQW